jgi:hypothetical protein
MEITDSQFLPYPDGVDPGDGALDLQYLAQAIDAKLVTAFANYGGVVNSKLKVSVLATNSTAISGNAGLIVYPIFTTWTTLYDSTGGLEPANPFDLSGFDGGGVYRIGWSIQSQPTGAVDVLSERSMALTINVALDASSPPAFTTEFIADTAYEVNLGATSQLVDSEFWLPFPGQFPFVAGGSYVRPSFFHQNTSSTVQILAGSLAWIYRVGDLEQ